MAMFVNGGVTLVSAIAPFALYIVLACIVMIYLGFAAGAVTGQGTFIL